MDVQPPLKRKAPKISSRLADRLRQIRESTPVNQTRIPNSTPPPERAFGEGNIRPTPFQLPLTNVNLQNLPVPDIGEGEGNILPTPNQLPESLLNPQDVNAGDIINSIFTGKPVNRFPQRTDKNTNTDLLSLLTGASTSQTLGELESQIPGAQFPDSNNLFGDSPSGRLTEAILSSGVGDVISPGGILATKPATLRRLFNDVNSPSVIEKIFGSAPELSLSNPVAKPPTGNVVFDLQDMQRALDSAFEPNNARRLGERLAQYPVIRQALGVGNPSLLADDIVSQARIVHMQLLDEGKAKLELAMSHPAAIGHQDDLFGKTNPITGLIKDGKYAGHSINEIAENPSLFNLGNAEAEWLRRMREIESQVVDLMRANGVDFKTLDVSDVEHFATRNVMHKLDKNGEIIQSAFIREGSGSSRLGSKSGFEKHRQYDKIADAQADGFVYAPYEDSVRLKVQKAYRRVADEKVSRHILNNLPDDVYLRKIRTDPRIVEAAKLAGNRVKTINNSINVAQRAIRGERITASTITAIERILPDIADDLNRALSIPVPTVNQVINNLPQELAGRINNKSFREALEQVRLARTGRGLKSAPGRTGVRSLNAGEAAETIRLLARDDRTSSRMLRDIYRNAFQALSDEKKISLKNTIARAKNMLPEAQANAKAMRTAKRIAGEQARRVKPTKGEFEVFNIPAFQKKIFAGNNAKDFTERINKAFRPALLSDAGGVGRVVETAIETAEKVNSVQRTLALAGDASLFMIQQAMMIASHPKAIAKSGKTFAEEFALSIMNPREAKRFRANLIAENRDLISRYPSFLLSNTNEFTQALNKGGLFAPDSKLGKIAIPLRPFQQAYETAMDRAGIEMLNGLDHMGTTAGRRREIGDYVNVMRGITSSQSLGVSSIQQSIEAGLLLAPRYRRAVAAMYMNAFQGGLRGSLAKKAIARFMVGMHALGIGYTIQDSWRQGKTFEEIQKDVINTVNPASPMYMTWRIGGNLIGPGYKMRSDVAMLGKIAATGLDYAGIRDAPPGQNMLDFSSFNDNPTVKWLRGQSAAVIQTPWDIFSGRNYLGEPVSLDPRNRDEFIRMGKELSENLIMLWLSSSLFETGDISERAIRGGSEFIGLRAYPEHAQSQLSFQRMEELRSRGIRNTDFFDADSRIQREINSLPHIQELTEQVLQENGIKGRLYARYKLEKQAVQERWANQINTIAQESGFGTPAFAGQVGARFRKSMSKAYSERAVMIKGIEESRNDDGELRYKQVLDFLDEIEPSEQAFDEALDRYTSLIYDEDLYDEITFDFDYETRDERLRMLENDPKIAPFIDEIVEFIQNRENQPAAIQQWQADTEIMKPYLEIKRKRLRAKGLIDEDEEYRKTTSTFQQQLFLAENPQYAIELELIELFKEAARVTNPEMEEALWRWGYITSPRSPGLMKKQLDDLKARVRQ